jgi:hypothetical protein
MDLDAEHRPLVGVFVRSVFLTRTGIHLKTPSYQFFVHVRHPSYRLVTRADVPFPAGTSADEWQLTRSREAGDVNAEVREAVERDGYSLFRIGLSLSEIPNS